MVSLGYLKDIYYITKYYFVADKGNNVLTKVKTIATTNWKEIKRSRLII
jgi:hypothetical protein